MRSWLHCTLVAIVVANSAHAGVFGPSNYDECIIDSMKGVSSNVAARAIIDACRKRFPPPKTKPVPTPPAAKLEALPLNELHRIEAQAVADSRELIGTFYNGNRAWGVREVVVRVAFGNTERDYSIRTDLKPLSSTHFALNVMVDPGTTWTWSIIGARGIRE